MRISTVGRLAVAGVVVVAVAALACGGGGGTASSGGSSSGSSSGSSGNPGSSGGPGPTSTSTSPLPPPGAPLASAPRAVTVARATAIPACTSFVDAAAGGGADGTAAHPFTTIGAAVAAAANGAIICVAQGTYAEALTPGTKYFTLAGGFQSGKGFTVRDSSMYVSKAQGSGSKSFISLTDPAPTAGQLTAVDGFEITGYSQGIVRDAYYPQDLDITNDYIHDNTCVGADLTGGGFSLNNVTGKIAGNVIAHNTCTRGGGGSIYDSTNSGSVSITNNLVDSNVGNEAGVAGHGGGLYLFCHSLTLTANEFKKNTITAVGGGLYVGAATLEGIQTTATLSWNVYHDNQAGEYGGGFFCDDSAQCTADHETYYANCGGNVYLDCGPDGSGPTVASFDHTTNYGALAVGCSGPGAGVTITKNNTAADAYSFTNSVFWGNAPNTYFDASCGSGCNAVTVKVGYSTVQTAYKNGGVAISFGDGIQSAADPAFVDATNHDFHLRSTHGHWAPTAYAIDPTDSPALRAGDPGAPTNDGPARAGDRTELGAFGDSVEASLVE